MDIKIRRKNTFSYFKCFPKSRWCS